MRYGRFDDARREYVIHRPDTPLPWINYLGDDTFVGIISNTAGGYTFYRDARLRRLTRYRHNAAPADGNGRYIYLRDEATGEYWSPTWRPTQTQLDAYECRHGLGYAAIAGTLGGIEAQTTYFVPLDETLEIWAMRLTNHRSESASLSLFSAVEFCLWNAHDDATNFQRNLNTGEVAVASSTIVHKTEYRERRNHFATFSCSEPLAGFETQRDAFLGPYRGWDRPQAVERGATSNEIGVGGSPVGVHHVRLELQPGETKRVVFVLAYHEEEFPARDSWGRKAPDVDAARRAVDVFLRPARVDEALTALREHWERELGALQVNTGVPDMDRMVNTWNAYQCAVTFNVSRSASRYESGIGRGIGFRDANQDLLGCVHMIPDRARARILDLASTQLVSGGAYHQYQPLTRQGNDEIGSGFNDDPLWLIYAAAAYLKETGDTSILDEPVPYGDDREASESLYDHLLRAADYTTARLGPHGLPLIGRADWNDCLNLNSHSSDPDEPFQTVSLHDTDVAESVFIAGLFCLACNDLVEIARRRGDEATERRLRTAVERMHTAIDTVGWDGDWFLRAYDATGAKIGSRENAEGRLFVEPQGICPMAGVGLDDGRAASALEAVDRDLSTDHGLLLVQPAFQAYRPELGEISSYPPGYKENGSIFCHTNPWIVIAACRLGQAERAWDVAMRINPSHREAISEVHRCEPYVYAQTIVGRDAADHGRARNSWLTGTAAWAYVAATQWILGIRPTFNGLTIDPCLPPDLDGFEAVRRYRGATYSIRVERSAVPGDAGVIVRVDGDPIEGQILPVFQDGGTHAVHVMLGHAPCEGAP